MMKVQRRTAGLWLAGLSMARAFPALAQGTYPNRKIRLIVPYPPGGSSDATARLVAQRLQSLLGQTVVVDNQGGASGIIGTLAAARAAPDGYTLMFSTSTNHVIAPLLRQPQPYDPVKDFTPIAPFVIYDGAIVVNSALPVATVSELIAYSKAHPKMLNYSSAGIGSTNHLATEQFKAQTGADLVHVPYKGGAASTLAVASNEVQVTIDVVSSALPLAKAGRVRLLAVNTPTRSPLAPEVPTFAEAGVKDIANYWQGLSGPAHMSKDIVALLNRATTQVMETPEMKSKLADVGATVVSGSAESFAESIAKETANWTEVIRVNGIKAE